MKAHAFVPLLMLTFALASPAEAQAPPASGSTPEQSDTTAAHLGVGTIRSIDVDRRIVTIEHRAIPSLKMPAMTMPFRLAESISADSLPVGQSIAFFLSPATDGVVITSIQAIVGSPQAAGELSHDENMPGMRGNERPAMPGMHGRDMMMSNK